MFLQISGPGDSDMARPTWVHHNYFFNHTFSGSNGGESIRHGYSYRNLSQAFGVIEYNLFERADGDSEAISVKSSDNVIRYNTLRDRQGRGRRRVHRGRHATTPADHGRRGPSRTVGTIGSWSWGTTTTTR